MLLQAHLDPVILSTLVLSAGGLILGVYSLLRGESRQDGQTTSQRLQKIDVMLATHEKRQEGFQIEIENVADQGRKARQAIIDNNRRDHELLREQIKDMPDMRQLLARMDERFLNTKEEMKSLAAKLDRVVELLTHK